MEDPKLISDLATLGATAWASKDIAGKLLGPSFEYVGGEIRNFAEKCNINLTDVFMRARRKLGGKIETPGGVGARVLKDVLDQGAFCDDAIAAEYVAGVLAASRTDEPIDDRGVTYLAVIRQLSRHQLRAHYLIYSSLKVLLNGQELSALNFDDAPRMRLFLSLDFLRDNLILTLENEDAMTTHVLNGLARNDLIGSDWWGGDITIVNAGEPEISEGGYFVTPTGFGVELLLWAHGHADRDVSEFLSNSVSFTPFPDVTVIGRPVHSPDWAAQRERERQQREALQRQNEEFVKRTIAARRGY